MNKEDIEKKRQAFIEQVKKQREENWKHLEPFDKPDDVPELPIVDKEKWDNFYVPKLIECGAIPKDKLVVGKKYIGSCRNADVAIWNGSVFIYDRYKFGVSYKEEINHFQDDNGYDLFVPIKEV